jgi:hypothetical protein
LQVFIKRTSIYRIALTKPQNSWNLKERERMVAESIHLLHRSEGFTTTLEQTTDSGSLGWVLVVFVCENFYCIKARVKNVVVLKAHKFYHVLMLMCCSKCLSLNDLETCWFVSMSDTWIFWHVVMCTLEKVLLLTLTYH